MMRHGGRGADARCSAGMCAAAAAVLTGALCAAAWAAESAIALTAPVAVAPECLRQGRRIQRQPAAAWAGEVCLVAWCDGTRQADSPTADIYCARVDGAGKPLDPTGIRVCGAADLQEWPAVASDGSSFLVVWQDFRNGRDYDIYAARVGADGRVLDPDGFAVCARAGNQARPAVAFAGGNWIVVWMDARQYPVYGLYAARVSPEGKVLDADGRAIDAEDPGKIQKAMPTTRSWLGDRHYWWNALSSRFHPSAASDGQRVMVCYLREVHANKTTAWAVVVNPADCAPAGPPRQVPGEPRDRVAVASAADGWITAFDHWISGWSPTPRLAACRLDAAGAPRDAVPNRTDDKPGEPQSPLMLDLQKLIAGAGAGEYQQGKGHFTFWRSAVACGPSPTALVAGEYGWRTKGKPADLHFAIVLARFDCVAGRFIDEPPTVAARGDDGVCVRHPALARSADGRTLLVYEKDAGVDRLTIESALVNAR